MYEENVTEQDFYQLTWDDFDHYAKKIASDIKTYCETENIKIDFICPIIRGGAVLATYLSHLLEVIPCIGVQFKHLNTQGNVPYEEDLPTVLWEGLSFFPEEKRIKNEYFILLVEGNHCSGITSIQACRMLKQYFPRRRILYASLVRDYKHRNAVAEAIFQTSGYYSNESQEDYSPNFMEEHRIADKKVVFPWEVLQEEINECNRIEIPIETNLIS